MNSNERLNGELLVRAALCRQWRLANLPLGGGGPRGKRPPPWQSRARAYADCREGPELRIALHRPGATRHPWREAPSYGHPDRAPAPFNPPLGPADGADLGEHAIKLVSYEAIVGASEARDALAFLPLIFFKERAGVGFALGDSDDLINKSQIKLIFAKRTHSTG